MDQPNCLASVKTAVTCDGHTFTAVFSLKSHEVKVLHYTYQCSGAAPWSRWGASLGTGGVPTLGLGPAAIGIH